MKDKIKELIYRRGLRQDGQQIDIYDLIDEFKDDLKSLQDLKGIEPSEEVENLKDQPKKIEIQLEAPKVDVKEIEKLWGEQIKKIKEGLPVGSYVNTETVAICEKINELVEAVNLLIKQS